MHGKRPDRIRDLTQAPEPMKSFGSLPNTPIQSSAPPDKKKKNRINPKPRTLATPVTQVSEITPQPGTSQGTSNMDGDNGAAVEVTPGTTEDKYINKSPAQTVISIPSSSPTIPTTICPLPSTSDKSKKPKQCPRAATSSAPPFSPYPRSAPSKSFPSEMGRNVLSPYMKSSTPPRVELEASKPIRPLSAMKEYARSHIFGWMNKVTPTPPSANALQEGHELTACVVTSPSSIMIDNNNETDEVGGGGRNTSTEELIIPTPAAEGGEEILAENSHQNNKFSWLDLVSKALEWKTVPIGQLGAGESDDADLEANDALLNEEDRSVQEPPAVSPKEEMDLQPGPSSAAEGTSETIASGDGDAIPSTSQQAGNEDQDNEEEDGVDRKKEMAEVVLDAMNVHKLTEKLTEMADIKRNIFLESMQGLQSIISSGFFQLLCPFRIIQRNGRFALKWNIIHAGISIFLLGVVTSFQATKTYNTWNSVDIKDAPTTAAFWIYDLLTTMLFVSYIFIVTFRRTKFLKMFEGFNVKSDAMAKVVQKRKTKLSICLSLVALLSFTLTNYIEWGQQYVFGLEFDDWRAELHEEGLKYGFKECKNTQCQERMVAAVLAINVMKAIWLLQIDFLQLGAAICTYNAERATRTFVFDNTDVDFDIQKGIDVYSLVKRHVYTISSAIGPLTLLSVAQSIPLCVLMVDKMAANQFKWYDYVIIGIKVGRLWIAAEAAANSEKLGEKLLTDRVDYDKEETNKIMELTNLTRKPISLWAMDFFPLNYILLMGTGGGILTYYIFTVELRPGGILYCHCIGNATE